MGKPLNRDHSKEYLNLNHGNASASMEVNKRVWVKMINGYPTSIMMNRWNIIDDLKAAVFEKYPNTIAKFHDSSELRIFVSLQKREQVQQTKMPKNKVPLSRLKSETSDEPSYKTANDPTNEPLLALLEPDRNVWEVLDEFFGSDMRMSEALIIDVGEQSQISSVPSNLSTQKYEEPRIKDFDQFYSPSPSQVNIQRQASITSSLQTPKPQNPQQFSKVLEKTSPESPRYASEASPVANAHKRSQSSPSQSPISLTAQTKSSNSQAVLLLPKNFSLGEQNSLKRLSLDENLIHKTGASQKSNVTNIGTRTPDKRSNLGKDSINTANQLQNIESNSESNLNSSLSKPDGFATRTEGNKEMASKSHSSPQEHKRDRGEKTLNTSTFEQVLPSISVLVVEDNSINQAILGAFLRKHKIHYQIAKNGQEAVDKWRKGGFHLVLMDIQLPVKSGIEATKEIRFLEKVNRIGVFAQHELANSQAAGHLQIKEDQKLDLNVFRSPVIIVALTASSNSSVDKKNALTAGCNDFLTKPVNLVWLQNKITEWGCMQSLIDFDGWRCKGNSSTPSSIKSVSS